MLIKSAINSQPFIGTFSVTSENITVIPPSASKTTFAESLETSVLQTTIGGTRLVGALACANSQGLIVADIISDRELDILLEQEDVTVISETHNALGNNVLINDYGALINPSLSKDAEKGIKENFDIDVVRGTIAGMRTVGSLAVVTNKGLLCHPHATDKEINLMEELFDISVTKITANHGSGWVGTCIVANTKGAVIGDETTPIEMGRIEEGLGYLD